MAPESRTYPWLSLAIALTLTGVSCIFLAPHLVSYPDLVLLPDVILRHFLPAALPEPLEQLRYLMLISCMPVIFLGAMLLGSSLKFPILRRCEHLTRSLMPPLLTMFIVWNIGYQELRGASFFGITAMLRNLSYFALLAWIFVRATRRHSLRSIVLSPYLALLLGALYTVFQLLPALYTETSMYPRNATNELHLPYVWDEFQAAVSGKTFLVDFFPMYTRLLPYLLQPLFSVFGCDLSVYGLTMSMLSLFGLLGVFYGFRRASGSWALALAVYFLFLSATAWPISPHGGWRVSVFSFPSMTPVRYFFPWLLTALWAVQLSAPSLSRAILVSVVSALALLNNLDFGLPAFAGGLAALWFCQPRWRYRTGILMLAALCFVILGYQGYTFYRSGHLPAFGQLLLFQKAFAVYGVTMVPMPMWGEHWVAIGTLLVALLFAILMFVRNMKRSDEIDVEERVRWGLLSYSAVFGLGAFGYYVGRSKPEVLTVMLSAWWLCLGLLVIEYLKNFLMKGRGDFWITAGLIASLSPVFTMATNYPSLRAEIRRLTFHEPTFQAENLEKAKLVGRYASPGESVLIIAPFGYRIAALAKVDNISPFSGAAALVLKAQIPMVMQAVVKHSVKAVFAEALPEELAEALKGASFVPVQQMGRWEVWKR